MTPNLVIRRGTIAEAVTISRMLPEFNDPYGAADYEKRFANKPHLVSIALLDNKLTGFKVAYERDGFCYSWLGGILPNYRRQGIAKALADAQEEWAAERGYTSITMKTRNRHRNMLFMALSRGFNIIGFEEYPDELESRIWLRKAL